MSAFPSTQVREGTRERLIEAARELFSENGYAETGTRAIAARADCNISLIKHYFGSKQGLLIAIVKISIAELGERMRETLSQASSAEDRLSKFIDVVVDHFDRNREGMRVFHREVMQSDSTLVSEIKPIAERNAAMIGGLLAEARAGGELREVDPRYAGMLLMAMMQFYFVAYPVSSKVLGERTPELIASLKAQIKQVFLHGVLR